MCSHVCNKDVQSSLQTLRHYLEQRYTNVMHLIKKLHSFKKDIYFSHMNQLQHTSIYRRLIVGSAQNNSKNRCLNFRILLAFFAEYNIIFSQNCQKVIFFTSHQNFTYSGSICEYQRREGAPFVIKLTYISPQRIWVKKQQDSR